MIQATSLSFNIKGPCNAKCPFCIARCTWKPEDNGCSRMSDRFSIALRYMQFHQIDTLLITGSGEPLVDQARQDLVILTARRAQSTGIPIIEVQTNGQTLSEDPNLPWAVCNAGITTIAISVASRSPEESARCMGISHNYLETAKKLSGLGFLVRVSLNLTKADADLGEPQVFSEYIQALKDAGVRQLTLRELGIPENGRDTAAAAKVTQWVNENRMSDSDVSKVAGNIFYKGNILRKLHYGPAVYDYEGMSVVLATCMTETQDPTEIRSIIFQSDGHGYHSWNYTGSILF